MNRFRIRGFRRLLDVDLNIRPLMVLIGANGIGKTSILDAISLLSASAAGGLNKELNRLGGIGSLLTVDRADEISMTVNMKDERNPGSPLEYQLDISSKAQSYAIPFESLTSPRGRRKPFIHIESFYDNVTYYEIQENKLITNRPNWSHNPLESSLSQVPKMYPEPEEFRRILSSASKYHVLDVGERALVKLPQQMKPAELPGEEGEDLVSFLYYLREANPDRFSTIIDTLKAAFKGFENLNFPPVAAGMLAMTWKENSFSKPLYMHQLSEGTLRFLWLVSLLQSPGLSTITMIDEPEVSLHPEMLSLLADLMREASQRTQLVVATHSDRLIRFLQPDEVVVMDETEDGCTSATWADTLDLNRWLEDYSLDEVWRLGRMGGRS
ncbi:MAG: AAA family ATPase [Candidatus Hatepunaea meridiana]|nr:AAA family ATPase [Candidatus Hatepunaea meridiana]